MTPAWHHTEPISTLSSPLCPQKSSPVVSITPPPAKSTPSSSAEATLTPTYAASVYRVRFFSFPMTRRMMAKAIIFLILTCPFPSSVTASIFRSCSEEPNYDSSMASYRANLYALLPTLPTKVIASGFYNASAGQVNTIVLCRGDLNANLCRQCVQSAILQLPHDCPDRKQAIIWYSDCMLRYSNDLIFGRLATSPHFLDPSQGNAVSTDQDLRRLLTAVRHKAADGGGSQKKYFAVGNLTVTASDLQSVYALVQCTPDLHPQDCDRCLVVAAREIPRRLRGGTVYTPSCMISFDPDLSFDRAGVEEIVQVSSQTGKDDGDRTRTVAIAVATSTVCLVVVVIFFIGVFVRMKRKCRSRGQIENIGNIDTLESLQYGFNIIRAATNDFSDGNKLGEGGFGAVYKGILPTGQEIAVKRLSKGSVQGSLEFKAEVRSLAKLQHRNLIKLLGYSIEGKEKLLVYGFAPNGSLDHFIFDPIKKTHLDWDTRFKIIKGVARGILYLHTDSRVKIIHRDLKPSNVLLDEDMAPKIADFGMAKIFGQDEIQGNTNRIVGTYGYMPPEYAMHGHYSVKSDVYSFGVLILEIISGQKSGIQDGEHIIDLASFAWKNWHNGTNENTLDPCLRSSTESIDAILRCIQIGLLCVQKNATDRPTMDSVARMLSTFSTTLAAPYKPAFYFPTSKRTSSEAQSSEYMTNNEVSASEFFPR